MHVWLTAQGSINYAQMWLGAQGSKCKMSSPAIAAYEL